MSVHKSALAVTALCASLLFVPATAVAKASPATAQVKTLTSVPLTGSAQNGKQFTGRFDVNRFVTRQGKTFAVGTLTGKLGNRHVDRSNVSVPVGVANSAGMTPAAAPAIACSILHLDLGPLNLNLLGLTVHLNEVILDIDAVPGAGNLLGNLLCSVANLLATPSVGGAQATGLLNIVQQLLSTPSLLSL